MGLVGTGCAAGRGAGKGAKLNAWGAAAAAAAGAATEAAPLAATGAGEQLPAEDVLELRGRLALVEGPLAAVDLFRLVLGPAAVPSGR